MRFDNGKYLKPRKAARIRSGGEYDPAEVAHALLRNACYENGDILPTGLCRAALAACCRENCPKRKGG